MILLPSAAGTVNTPPLIFAPGRAVVMEGDSLVKGLKEAAV